MSHKHVALLKLIGQGFGAVVGGPICSVLGVGATLGLGGVLSKLPEEFYTSVGETVSNVFGNLFSDAIRDGGGTEYPSFNHDLRKAMLAGLIKCLADPSMVKRLEYIRPTEIPKERWTKLMKDLHRFWLDHLKSAEAQSKVGNFGPLMLLFPAASDTSYIPLMDPERAATVAAIAHWDLAYEQILAPIARDVFSPIDPSIATPCNAIKSAVLASVSADFPKNFAESVKKGDGARAWIAFQKLFLLELNRVVSGLPGELAEIRAALQRLSAGQIDQCVDAHQQKEFAAAHQILAGFRDAVLSEMFLMEARLTAHHDRRVDESDRKIVDRIDRATAEIASLIARSSGYNRQIPRQLPLNPPFFTGRDNEIRLLLERIRSSEDAGINIASLRGLGGIGKSALCTVLANRLAEKYPDGQLYVDLMGRSRQPLPSVAVMAQVIRTFEPAVAVSPDESGLAARYHGVLAGKRVLVYLDNAYDRKQVEDLIVPGLGTLFLITSRDHLGLSNITVFDVPTLSPEDANNLLLRICPRIGSHASELARLSGYHAKALETNAGIVASSKLVEPAWLVEKLGDSATARVDPVRAALDLSYELLPAASRQRWRLLGIFPGAFDLHAAGAVWQVPPDEVRLAISALERSSLVVVASEDSTERVNAAAQRVKLHDLAREYALEKLSDEEREVAWRRHAEFYAAQITEMGGRVRPGRPSSLLVALEFYDRERPNLDAARTWAEAGWQTSLACSTVFATITLQEASAFGLRHSEREMIRRLLIANEILSGAPDEAALADLHRLLGDMYGAWGQFDTADSWYVRSMGLARRCNDLARLALAMSRRAVLWAPSYRDLGSICADSASYARESGDLNVELAVLSNVIKASGGRKTYIERRREVIGLLKEDDLLTSAETLVVQGAWNAALRASYLALHASRQIRDRVGEAHALALIAKTYYGRAEMVPAARFGEDAATLFSGLENSQSESEAWLLATKAANLMGDLQGAMRCIEHALGALSIGALQLDDFRAIKVSVIYRLKQRNELCEKWRRDGEDLLAELLGEMEEHSRSRRWKAAIKTGNRALATPQVRKDPRGEALFRGLLAKAYFNDGAMGQAAWQGEIWAEQVEGFPDSELATEAWAVAAIAFALLGDRAAALRCCIRARNASVFSWLGFHDLWQMAADIKQGGSVLRS